MVKLPRKLSASISLALGIVLSFLLQAYAASAADHVSVTSTSKLLSRYVGNNGAVLYNKPVVQTDVFVLLPRGFYADLWWSTGLDSTFSNDGGDEIDWNVGWSGQIGAGVVFDVGVSFLDLAELFRGRGPIPDFVQPYTGIEKTFTPSESHSLTPYLRIEFLLPVRDDVRKGMYVHLGLKHTWKATEFLVLNQKAFVLYDTGVAGFDPALIGQYQTSFDWSLSKRWTLSAPIFKFSIPLSSVSSTDGRESKMVYGFGLSFLF